MAYKHFPLTQMPSPIILFLWTTQAEQILLLGESILNIFYFSCVASGQDCDLTLMYHVTHLHGLWYPKRSPLHPAEIMRSKQVPSSGVLVSNFVKALDKLLALIITLSSREKAENTWTFFVPFLKESGRYSRDITKWLVNHSTCLEWPLCEKSILGTLQGTQRK